MAETADKWISCSLDPEQTKQLEILKLAAKKHCDHLYIEKWYLNGCQGEEDKIAEILAERGDIPSYFHDLEARTQGKTQQEQERQDMTMISVATKSMLARDGTGKSTHTEHFYLGAVNLVAMIGQLSPFSAVKKNALNILNPEEGVISQLGSIASGGSQRVLVEGMRTSIARTTNDIELIKLVQKSLIGAIEEEGFNPEYANLLLGLGAGTPEKAHLIAETFGEIMASNLEKEHENQDEAAINNTLLAQESLLELQNPTTVQILQRLIRSDFPVGVDKETFSSTAADNLHNAYAQLIENGKLSGEMLDTAHIMLAQISDQHSQYRQDAFQLAQDKLYNRADGRQQINHGAYTAVQIIGSHKDFTLKAFNVLADLIGGDTQDDLSIITAIIAAIQTMPSLTEQGIHVLENYLAEHPNLGEEDSEIIFDNLTTIALSNHNNDAVLDIMDLLGKEHARNPAAAQTALKKITDHYPIYKNKNIGLGLN